MTNNEKKLEFIKLRAAGESYKKIAEALHISKATCTNWSKELEAEIASLKAEQLNELYETYCMTKEARIRQLGDTLGRIDDALMTKDLKEVPTEKLLELKLKYESQLKAEYIPPREPITDFTPEGMLEAFKRLYDDLSNKRTTPAEAGAIINALHNCRSSREIKRTAEFLGEM